MAMTADALDAPMARQAAPANVRLPKPRMQWGTALKALQRLLNDKEDTGQVFEIMRALNGTSTADCYQRLLTTTQGGRIAYERQELADRLMDDAWLDSLAPGTVGAAYRDFVRSEELSAEGLAEVSRIEGNEVDIVHPYAWMGRRTRDVHDIWHILSGYHRDGLGESCLVAFSYAQTKGLGWALIALGAASRSRGSDYPYVKAIWQGYQRGKAARWLLGEDYERLLNEPLDAARERLGITPATIYESIPVEARDGAVPARM
ncbi:ubiquinone biosynthesis protein [Phenylobacterium sp. Root77]|uniref:Coq4 family protein n=1 Tax=unclassified Phenylobacterium TaxID=2640670 RepID=UPI0006FFA8FC|nr:MULTISPECIES: Coq4 family protein [unclassified Phenylobacterium]KQW72164.1 ubiquinone biosynthesis protein [Phenylobacterium sp. Root1277]KQW95084.1 ubiquinone biosynthesis protein [Phenylobacterium sp. Root1290]KRC44777.1 ubiquinone biosynthesis protein [Phenylobacterium sp. Root77]